MKNVTIYSGPNCAFCDAAKRLLTRNNISYNEINIALDPDKRDEMLKRSNGMRTIPQIFFDEKHIGQILFSTLIRYLAQEFQA